jgi:two-component system, chemotaxis family, sensor kinase CheA
MSASDEAFMKELMEAFKAEAAEHLHAVSDGLLRMEKDPNTPDRPKVLETIYREAHSLKGAARAVGFSGIESICQTLENALAAWKRGDLDVTAGQFDAFYRALDGIGQSIATGRELCDMTELAAQIGASGVSQPAARTAATPAPPQPSASAEEAGRKVALRSAESGGSIRVAVGKLDTLLFQAEEMLAVKQAIRHHAEALTRTAAEVTLCQRRWLKGGSDVLRARPGAAPGEVRAEQLRAFLDAHAASLKSLQDRVGQSIAQFRENERMTDRMIDGILENAKRVVMVPSAMVLQVFPRMVRDLCHSQGKQADLAIRGEDVEVDKRVLEEMKDPLTHLLRNCVDHGLERPEERVRKGKSPAGSITVAVAQSDSRTVLIEVSDDGPGIDAAAVKAAALRMGLIAREDAERLDPKGVLQLVFASSLSTSAEVTSISGRGLGLAIVREKVEKLGGSVEIGTNPGKGTTIRMFLPLTLATFRGILVEVSGQAFVVPTLDVERVARVRREEVSTIENRETLLVDGRAVAHVRISDILKLPAASVASYPVLLVGSEERRIAFRVDRILGEQEVLVKSLGKQLRHVPNIAGATVLGSGEVVLILNVTELVRAAAASGGVAARSDSAAAETGRRGRSVLVVEDSITSRMLLKSILETAGYAVKTSVNGEAAWMALMGGGFDAVVSDVEMPRMNGFALTAKIRSDSRLQHLPVVLVTAREAEEDRRRGAEAGANAYIVKSRFEQSDLLKALEGLV